MKNIRIEVGNLKYWDCDAGEKIAWFADNCLEFEKNKGKDGIYNLYFKFGENEDNDYHTNDFSLTRADARNFIVAYLDNIWGDYSDYHIDSLWFASDGDEDDCQYVIKAEVYKQYGNKD